METAERNIQSSRPSTHDTRRLPTGQAGTTQDAILNSLALQRDVAGMTQEQKVEYVTRLCHSLGLNPLTQPFAFIRFRGREKLYAMKDCTEQLRKIHGVSITDVSASELHGMYVVTAKAADKNGKTDAATGAVPINNLYGDYLANALMKAETKAKRRVTLSICGLGILDESELDTLPMETENARHKTQDALRTTRDEWLEQALLKLNQCTSVEELTMLKDSLDEQVLTNRRFIEAGVARYKKIVAN